MEVEFVLEDTQTIDKNSGAFTNLPVATTIPNLKFSTPKSYTKLTLDTLLVIIFTSSNRTCVFLVVKVALFLS